MTNPSCSALYTGKRKTGVVVLCITAVVIFVRISTYPYDWRTGAVISLSSIEYIPAFLRRSTFTMLKPQPTDPLDYPPELPSVNKSGRYVSMCSGNFDNRRIGNQLFNFAAMLHVARLTGRRVAMVLNHPHGWLDRVFKVPITRVQSIERELCPCTGVGEGRGLAYERSMNSLPNRTDLIGKSLLVCGWFQSWKYTIGVETQLRRLLQPRDEQSKAVRSFFDSSRPSRWMGSKTVTRIGIHIRAGDVMINDKFSFGYTIPKRPFFELAMANATNETKTTPNSGDSIRRYQFFVLSDSIDWVQTTLGLTSIGSSLNSSSVDVEVTYSVGNTAAFDLVLMSMCDVVIMTTGTYGWWGAWLANSSKTIYYKNWPRPGSSLYGIFSSEDFFPSDWISFEGPYYEF